MVTSATSPASTCAMNSLNLTGVSFFWNWAKCQARKTTTSNDIQSITVLNVAFTSYSPSGRPPTTVSAPRTPGEELSILVQFARSPYSGRGMVPT